MSVDEAAEMVLTMEDFNRIALPHKRYELEYGRLVEVKPGGNERSNLGTVITHSLHHFLGRAHPRCVFDSSARFRLARDPDLIRGPDACYVPPDQLPPLPWPDGAMDVVPALAVEIVSHSNTASGIETKIDEYLAAGVRLVWVIHPDSRRVYIYDSPDSVQVRHETGTITGGNVLPGFELSLEDLFGAPGP